MDIVKVLRLLSEKKQLEEISVLEKCSVEDIKQNLNDLAAELDISDKSEKKNKNLEEVIIYTDGASRGNPGLSGIGCIIYDLKKNEIMRGKEFIGIATNNVAEYKALIHSLNILKNFKGVKKISFYLDSELVVKQIKGLYKVSNINMKEYYSEFISKVKIYKFNINHIPREKNSIADKLANEAIDEYLRIR